MTTVYIVGAGLFGAVLRDTLRAQGVCATVIDDLRPGGGSPPAGCLIRPSWLSSLGKDELQRSLGQLARLYGLKTVPVKLMGPLRLDSVLHVDPGLILRPPEILGTVEQIDPEQGLVVVRTGDPETPRHTLTGIVVVAAGVWSAQLLPEHFAGVPLRGMTGVSLRFAGSIEPARLKVWAPYKQSIAFNISDNEVWFGDGTSIKAENWDNRYVQRSLEHAQEVDPRLDASALLSVRVGARPVVPKHAGWCRRVGRRCWVSTGGGKNGVALAALQALRIAQEISP